MIAKRIDMRQASKSRVTRLTEYVTSELGKADRVADAFIANCLSDDPLIAAKEIEICQARNTRTKDDKTYHLLLSFPDGERPDKEQMREMADAAAKALGYGEHQRIAVVHDDTDNLHMHLIINKIHPQRHTIHTPRHDFKILGELCVKLEQSLSLKATNHEPVKSRSENRAQDLEKQSGTTAFLHYTREKATSVLSEAKSWEAAHQGLTRFGLTIQARGNGLVVVDHNNGVAVKASSLARDFSKAKLEERFGMFIVPDASQTRGKSPESQAGKPMSTYQKAPLAGTNQLYQQYLLEKEAAQEVRKSQLAAVWDRQKNAMRQIVDSAKLNLPKAASFHMKQELQLQARNIAKAKVAKLRQAMVKERAGI